MSGGGPVPSGEDMESLRRNKEIQNKRIIANITPIGCQVLLIMVSMNAYESKQVLPMGPQFS
jgi:hypothetical protein